MTLPSRGNYIPKTLDLCACGKESGAYSEGAGLPTIGHTCLAKVGERVRLAESIHTNEHVSSGALVRDCQWCWPHGAAV